MGKSIVINMERSEKLYESLKMRGFSGKLTFAPRKIRFIDIMILTLFIIMMITLMMIDLEAIIIGVVGIFLR